MNENIHQCLTVITDIKQGCTSTVGSKFRQFYTSFVDRQDTSKETYHLSVKAHTKQVDGELQIRKLSALFFNKKTGKNRNHSVISCLARITTMERAFDEVTSNGAARIPVY